MEIAAILPGQTPHRKFNIPTRNNSLERIPTTRSERQPTTENPRQGQPQSHTMGNLIDLSEPTAAAQEPPKGPQAPSEELNSLSITSQEPPNVQTKTSSEPIKFEPITSLDQTTSQSATPQEPSKPQSNTSKEEGLLKGIPSSKLLHSNPSEPPTTNDKLRRMDSETQEEDEFHDAHS